MKIKECREIGLCDSLLVASTEEMEAIAIGVKVPRKGMPPRKRIYDLFTLHAEL